MKRRKLFSLCSVVLIISMVFYPAVLGRAIAASLTDVEVALTNEATSATDNIVVTFTPNTAITDGTILEINYDDNFTGGASLLDADIDVTGTNITSSEELPADTEAGYFKSTLTCSAGVTTLITITIDGTNELTNPSSSGNYSWSVTADIGGAGSTFDYGAGLAYVANDNDVTVTATVPPTIDMEIYEANSSTPTNACALGVLSLSIQKTCVYDVAGATNNAAGMTVKINADAKLNSGADDIDDCTDGTVTPGAEEYGVRITDDGSSGQWDGTTYESQDEEVPVTETTFATTSAVIDGINVQADRLEVTHKATMATATAVASYDQLVTYTAFTN